MYLNNTANTKVRVDNTKNTNALLNDTNLVTQSPSIRERTGLSEYETSIMSKSGLESRFSGCQSRSGLNNSFVRDRWTGMNRAFIERLMDSEYAYDDTVQDLFDHCRYVDEDEDVVADVFNSSASTIAVSDAEDTTAFMSDSSGDESLDELEMSKDDVIAEMDLDLYEEVESLTGDVSTSLC